MTEGPQRAMKILYRPLEDPATILEKESMKTEAVVLPEHILSTLHMNLNKSNLMLPSSARVLQEWKVGVLNRF